MPLSEPPVLRSHALQRLLRLSPENTDIEALDRFIQERNDILSELSEIDAPWTLEEQDILEAAMRNAEGIMAQLETLQKQIAQQISGLRGANQWGEGAQSSAPARIKRRY